MDRLASPGLAAGRYIATIVRDGVTIDTFEADNVIVDEGLNNMLDAALRNSGAQTAWYLGLYGGAYTPVTSETAATVAANAGEVTNYTGGSRPQWRPAAAANRSITNAAQTAVFTFSGNAAVNGAFMISSSQLSGTSGKLMSIVQFGAAKNITAGDTLTLTYIMSLTTV